MRTNYMSGITQCRQNCLCVANGQPTEGKKIIPSHTGNKYYWSEKMKSFDRMPYSLSLKSSRKIYNMTYAIYLLKIGIQIPIASVL